MDKNLFKLSVLIILFGHGVSFGMLPKGLKKRVQKKALSSASVAIVQKSFGKNNTVPAVGDIDAFLAGLPSDNYLFALPQELRPAIWDELSMQDIKSYKSFRCTSKASYYLGSYEWMKATWPDYTTHDLTKSTSFNAIRFKPAFGTEMRGACVEKLNGRRQVEVKSSYNNA